MSWSFSPSLTFGFGQYGNAILSQYPIESTSMIPMPGREKRSILRAQVRIGGHSVNVLTTHLGLSEEDRRQQMLILMKELDQASAPTVLMGDFNMEIDHPLMQALSDKWRSVSPHAPTVLGGLEIDHIFTNIAVNAAKAWTLPTNASDHHPVVAELQWEQ